jgi:hypothetical protein
MELGSSGITSLRDWEVLLLGVPMLLAGFSARMECKFLVNVHPPIILKKYRENFSRQLFDVL